MSKLKRRFYKYLWLTRPLAYLSLALVTLGILYLISPKISPIFSSLKKGPVAVLSAINPSIKNLNNYKNRTNILLLGAGGGDHPGADLTDSIMLISINLLTSDTVLVSLPRDIWVESLNSKLNAAYHLGEQKQAGSGLTLTKSAVSEITNQPIHYGVMLDFSGFKKAIDIVGGIDLYVPRGFTDEKYPIPGKEDVVPESDRFEVIQFSPGEQHMDGSLALKYVRSRHAEGEEGTDYARSERQQRAILAFKEKLLSRQTIFNPKKIKNLKQTVLDSVKTDLPPSTYPDLLKLALRIDQTNIRTGIVDQGSFNEDIPPLLYNPPASLYGQWVLLPVNNDWQAIYTHISNILYQTP